jgi:hypothetical protein
MQASYSEAGKAGLSSSASWALWQGSEGPDRGLSAIVFCLSGKVI